MFAAADHPTTTEHIRISNSYCLFRTFWRPQTPTEVAKLFRNKFGVRVWMPLAPPNRAPVLLYCHVPCLANCGPFDFSAPASQGNTFRAPLMQNTASQASQEPRCKCENSPSAPEESDALPIPIWIKVRLLKTATALLRKKTPVQLPHDSSPRTSSSHMHQALRTQS